jgi:hypothetical protein
MTSDPGPVKVNRAPVLTLWAAVVAERLGHPTDMALSLASIVASTAARAKARRLGIIEEKPAAERLAPPMRETTRLLGRDMPLTHDADGVILADAGGGKPAPAAPVAAYVRKAFGDRLDEVRAAMEELAGRYPPAELNRIGFRLYEHFRPEVAADVRGWGAKGELHLAKVRGAHDRD